MIESIHANPIHMLYKKIVVFSYKYHTTWTDAYKFSPNMNHESHLVGYVYYLYKKRRGIYSTEANKTRKQARTNTMHTQVVQARTEKI